MANPQSPQDESSEDRDVERTTATRSPNVGFTTPTRPTVPQDATPETPSKTPSRNRENAED